MKPVAGYIISNNFGIEIYEIDEVNERVKCALVDFSSPDKSRATYCKVYYDREGNPYFKKHRMKVYLSECMRTAQ